VPLAWARATCDAVRADEVPAILHVFDRAGHCPPWDRYRTFTVNQSNYFLYYLMDLGNA
jgi:hypothetical protein